MNGCVIVGPNCKAAVLVAQCDSLLNINPGEVRVVQYTKRRFWNTCEGDLVCKNGKSQFITTKPASSVLVQVTTLKIQLTLV